MMLRNCFILVSLLLATGCGEDSHGQAPAETKGGVSFVLTAKINTATAPSDTLRLYDVWGPGQLDELLAVAPTRKTGDLATYNLKGRVPAQGAYYLGFAPNQVTEVLLGFDKTIELSANAQNLFGTVKLEKPAPNYKAYLDLQREMASQQQSLAQNEQALVAAQREQNLTKVQELSQVIGMARQEMAQRIDEAKTQGGVQAKLAAVYEYTPFDPNAPQADLPDQRSHFIANYMGAIDFSDPIYGYVPVVSQKFQAYINTLLASFNVRFNEFQDIVKPQLEKAPEGSKLRGSLLQAAINGVLSQNVSQHPHRIDLYIALAEQFVEEYPTHPATAKYQPDVDRFAALIIGKKAPNFQQAGLDGTPKSLDEVKGKVVLLDFWASWCRPCRAENPNVVRLYNAQKDNGFTVFSVSLDSNRELWKRAVAQDGLVWPHHTSDLKGWENEVAQRFGVSSIPQTFLLDANGIIVDKGLRGTQLEQRVKALLAEDDQG